MDHYLTAIKLRQTKNTKTHNVQVAHSDTRMDR